MQSQLTLHPPPSTPSPLPFTLDLSHSRAHPSQPYNTLLYIFSPFLRQSSSPLLLLSSHRTSTLHWQRSSLSLSLSLSVSSYPSLSLLTFSSHHFLMQSLASRDPFYHSGLLISFLIFGFSVRISLGVLRKRSRKMYALDFSNEGQSFKQ